MIRRLSLIGAFLCSLFLGGDMATAARPIVVDLAQHLVAVSTGFSGAGMLMFGAMDGSGDVVMVVRGPPEDVTVRKKKRIAGIYLNRQAETFSGAPSYYRVLSSRPLEEVAPPNLWRKLQVLPSNLFLRADGKMLPSDSFKDAFLRKKEQAGLYGCCVDPIFLMGNRLFRADMFLPTNAPIGAYRVEVYLIDDGKVVSAETTPLLLSKVGASADIFLFAQEQGALYGLLAILGALFCGWFAGWVFQRR